MRVQLTINGEHRVADDVWEGESLLFVLRERLALPGSKNACEQGECGSCTVLLDDVPVCSCLVAAGQAADRDVVTVEGLEGPGGLHPVQQAFIDAGAVQCGFCTPGLIVQAYDLLRQGTPVPADPDIREALAGNLCRCTGYEKILDAVRLAAVRWRRPVPSAGAKPGGAVPDDAVPDDAEPGGEARLMAEPGGRPAVAAVGGVVIEGCAIATMDGPDHENTGAEHGSGHIVVAGGRIVAVGEGAAADVPAGAVRIDGAGCLATPGLVNTHHHLYQWLTQGRAQQSPLFDWLSELYPVWARIGADQVHAAAAAGLAWLALGGCSTSTDHHYVFPRAGGAGSEALEAEVAAAARIGVRFHPCRGSMDLGRSAGGLPPDEIVEDTDAALAATLTAIGRFHDPSPGAMVRIAVGPCSPFTVSSQLMRDSAQLARTAGVRMHTHLAETREEDAYCRQRLGRTPAEYADELGWLGDDVWLAHCVHLDEAAVKRLAGTGTAVAHCPSSNARLGTGIAPVRALLRAGGSVGLGVDGAASSEGTSVAGELRQALFAARLRPQDGPSALTTRQALWLGTRGGARCLGRQDEIGALRPGMLADIALWRLDSLALDAIADTDPVTALVLGAPAPLRLLLVGGVPVVDDGELRTADAAALIRAVRAARRRLEPEAAR